MKSLNKLFLLLSVVIISSCSSNDITEKLSEETNQIRFTASDFKYENNSRTDFVISDSGAEFQWAENDTVGIFPDLGSQVYFPMASGAGTKTAAFDGGGWALKSSSTYAAYYPFKGNIYLNKTKIPVSYVGQKQVGNNSTEHLGAYDYMAAVASTPENGNVNFNFKHLGALVQISAIMPKPINVKTISININSEKIIVNGSLDLTTDELIITPIAKDKQIELKVEDIELNENNLDLTTYIMLPPCDLSNEDMIIKITGDNNESYYSTITGKTFEKGKAYKLVCNDIIDNQTFLTTVTPNTVAETPQQDINGTYILATASNMKWFYENAKNYKNTRYELVADITFSKVSWKPIPIVYNIEFNGNNHKIINLGISQGDEDISLGFFGIVSSSTIKNLVFINSSVSQYSDKEAYKVFLGTLAGTISSSKIINCGVINGKVSGVATDRATAYIGGLVGEISGPNTIKGCFVKDSELKGGYYYKDYTLLGGLAARIYYTSEVPNIISCYTYNITLPNNSDYHSYSLFTFSSNASLTSCCYEENTTPIPNFTIDNPWYTQLSSLNDNNFYSRMNQMNENLTDCDYIFNQDGLLLKNN